MRIVPNALLFSVIAAAATFAQSAAAANAEPTPLPGGAGEIKAQSGIVGHTVWNGAVRMTLVYLRDATPDETAKSPPSAGKKNLVFQVKIRNGLHANFQELVEYTIADKDDVTVSVPTSYYAPAALDILQGAAAVQNGVVSVDSDFVPVKFLAVCATCNSHSPFKPVRFSVPATER